MMLIERIDSLAKWGSAILNCPLYDLRAIVEKANNKNKWFTHDFCQLSLNEIGRWLNGDSLKKWVEGYPAHHKSGEKIIGIVMAGNIPLVGFHDLLCVLVSGNVAKIKLSSQDEELLPFLTGLLFEIDRRWEKSVVFVDHLNNIDAVIATGSDNSARYFESYFHSIPRIIRKNRTSVGVVMGEERADEFQLLSNDIFTYFGMGCRNVSKLLLPLGFDLNKLTGSFQTYQNLIQHSKYANNYHYQKTIRIISSQPFHDFGFVLLEETEELVSPIAVLHYQYYDSQSKLEQLLNRHKDKIQCTVSAKGWFKPSISFGSAQQPSLKDYADNVDTLEFLINL